MRDLLARASSASRSGGRRTRDSGARVATPGEGAGRDDCPRTPPVRRSAETTCPSAGVSGALDGQHGERPVDGERQRLAVEFGRTLGPEGVLRAERGTAVELRQVPGGDLADVDAVFPVEDTIVG
jgi:hypothetical protein